ncbi:uncharacterized protein LOC127708424 [Mytilus californianus]|uniref:uncharacterized protein LOC127708424 n=1 Tax=Mytilus californianus TaxID=6549 RepID=UPI002245AC9A|nr:uncharacterized protein LOC127708424 [Mytilus californianus]
MTNVLFFFCLSWITLANTEKNLTTINIPFNTSIPIICTSNSVIKISNISVETNSKCAPKNCSLSEQENVRTRSTCNGQSSCNITSNMPNSCLLELGFFSLSYSCLEVAHSCNFDNSWCGWMRFPKGKGIYKWKRKKGATKTKFTGPSKDHTSVSVTGFYVYSNAKNGNTSDIAQLTSGPIVSGPKQCLSFWYHMYGDDIGSLRVFQLNNVKGNEKRIFRKKSNQSDAWHQEKIDLKKIVGTYKIRFEAIHGNGPKGDIALDDISIVNKMCSDFNSQCRSSPGACKGTIDHIKSCQHVNETIELTECSNIYMNIDKSSLRFEPKFIPIACYAIYQQINDSLCTNVSSWDLCTLDMSKYIQDHPECFNRYTMKTEYECEDPQETVMNSTKFTETTPALFDITAQMTTEQLETTYLHLQTTDKSHITVAFIPLTSEPLHVTESWASKSESQQLLDRSIVAGLAVGAVVCFGIIIGLIILYCNRRSNTYKKGNELKYKSDNALNQKINLPPMNSNTINKVLCDADPDYQHYYEIKDIKRSFVNMQTENDLADNQKYNIPDQNNITGKRHEIGRHLNNSDYTVTEENDIGETGLHSFNVLKLQGKQDGKTIDKNNKTTTLSGRENNYTIIDQSRIEQDHEYDVISAHNDICHSSLPEISESATYVVLDPRETGFNRSTDHLFKDCKDVPNKFETSSLVNINGNTMRLKTATSASNVALDPKETRFNRTKRLTF